MSYTCFICQLSEIVRDMNCGSLSSILARRNNISFHTIICQSSFSSIFYPCLFSYITFHLISLFLLSLFLVASQLVCFQIHPFWILTLSLRRVLARPSYFRCANCGKTNFAFFELWHFSNSKITIALQTCSLSAFLFSQSFTRFGWTREAFSDGRGNLNSSFSAKIQEKFSSFTLFT